MLIAFHFVAFNDGISITFQDNLSTQKIRTFRNIMSFYLLLFVPSLMHIFCAILIDTKAGRVNICGGQTHQIRENNKWEKNWEANAPLSLSQFILHCARNTKWCDYEVKNEPAVRQRQLLRAANCPHSTHIIGFSECTAKQIFRENR